MSMTARDHAAIAAILRRLLGNKSYTDKHAERASAALDIRDWIADYAESQNPKFDRARFLRDCVKEPQPREAPPVIIPGMWRNDGPLIVCVEIYASVEAYEDGDDPLAVHKIDHNKPADRKVLGEQCRAAFLAGQMVVTYTDPESVVTHTGGNL